MSISQEQLGSGMRKNKEQSGDGLADLAIKALSHLIPALLAKFGEQAGSVLSKEAIEFAKKKGLLSQDGSGMSKKTRGRPRNDKRLRGDETHLGILTREGLAVEQYPTTTNFSQYATNPNIIAVEPKKLGKKGGSSDLAGGSSNLAGDGVFLAGVDTFVPKKRGRPPKPIDPDAPPKVVSGRGRGRPRKPIDPNPPPKPPPKRRGRVPKIVEPKPPRLVKPKPPPKPPRVLKPKKEKVEGRGPGRPRTKPIKPPRVVKPKPPPKEPRVLKHPPRAPRVEGRGPGRPPKPIDPDAPLRKKKAKM